MEEQEPTSEPITILDERPVSGSLSVGLEAAAPVKDAGSPESALASHGGNSIKLDNLPPEILKKICSYVFDCHDVMRVNIEKSHRGSIPWMFQYGFPEPIARMASLLLSNSRLRQFAQERVIQEGHFVANSYAFEKFPRALGRANARLVRNLQLELSHKLNELHEQIWPGLIKMFVKDMPELSELKIVNSWRVRRVAAVSDIPDNYPYPSTVEGQHRRTVLRLGAFIVLRHPKLKRLIWPADSGATYEQGESLAKVYIILDRGMNDGKGDFRRKWEKRTKRVASDRMDTAVFEDSVLNATAIRRYRHEELAIIPTEALSLHPEPGESKNSIVSSEVEEDSAYYRIVDERGYTTQAKQRERGWPGQDVDELLEFCDEAAQKSWAHIDLLHLLATERVRSRRAEEELARSENERVNLRHELHCAHTEIISGKEKRTYYRRELENKEHDLKNALRKVESMRVQRDAANARAEEEILKANAAGAKFREVPKAFDMEKMSGGSGDTLVLHCPSSSDSVGADLDK